MEYREHGPHQTLPPDDDRIVPLCSLLSRTWKRYHRPMIVAETSWLKHGRKAWLRDVMDESMAAVNEGIDLHVELQDVIDAAKRLKPKPDANWS